MNKPAIKFDVPALGQRTYSARSLHGRVVHELGRRIVAGDIAEGDVLPNEADLGREFKVSRTALREGIKVLTAKGLLVSRTRTGTRVRPKAEWNMLDPDILLWRMEAGQLEAFVKDLHEFRIATEPMAASLAATRATPADIEDLSAAVQEMDAAGDDLDDAIQADLRFHQLMLAASGNELLGSLANLIETAMLFSYKLMVPTKQHDAIPSHRPVFDAIQNRDPVAASEAMYELLDISWERTRTAVDALQDSMDPATQKKTA